MSTWGVGNFDNDMAGEVLAGIVFQLADGIQNRFSDEECNYSIWGETELMPTIDILLTLGKNYPDIVLPALKEYPLAEWREKYLDEFDRNGETTTDKEFMVARRPVIVKTFTELETLVQSHTY